MKSIVQKTFKIVIVEKIPSIIIQNSGISKGENEVGGRAKMDAIDITNFSWG